MNFCDVMYQYKELENQIYSKTFFDESISMPNETFLIGAEKTYKWQSEDAQ